ncbi:MAG: FtsX-like permease family protein [Pyrinomonadaceae bacterium]
METLFRDIHYGVRNLLKRPGFTAVAVITLALGIGANTTIFSVVNSVLLRPLPYQRPQELVQVNDSLASAGFSQAGLTQMEFVRLRNENKSFVEVGAYQSGTLTLTGAGEPERVRVTVVSDNFFSLLGINPRLGRTFLSGEDEQSRANVAMLAYDFWQTHFGANPNVINQTVTLGGNSLNIIGVLPEAFQSPADLQNGVSAQLVTPLGLNYASLNLGSHGVNTIGRLRPGVTASQAAAETNLIIGRVVKENPTYYPADGSFRSYLTPLQESIVGNVRLALLALLGAVGFVLLIACANVANLLLARGETRQKEISIRTALGASRWRVIRQLLAESLILALIGGGAGLTLAGTSLDLLVALNPGNIPRLEQIGLEPRVLLFTLALSLSTALIFGLIIIGIVGDIRHRALESQPFAAMYMPTYATGWMNVVIRTKGDPANLTAAVRKEVQAIDPDQPVAAVKTMERWVDSAVAGPRYRTALLGLFAGLALVLASTGIYGVMSYSVTQRTHEIGVRMALGARRFDVLKLVVRQGMTLVVLGVALGLVGAFALTRVMASLLYGVTAKDPVTFIAVATLLALVALIACYIPARRATKVDPLVALRYE